MESTFPFRAHENILPVLAHNLFIGSAGLDVYDESASPITMDGNIFLNGAKPSLCSDRRSPTHDRATECRRLLVI